MKNSLKMKTLLPLFLLLSCLAKAQEETSVLQFSASYGLQVPGGDLQERFGNNGITGLQVDWTLPSGWTAGLQASLLFGKNVREDVLAPLRDENGLLYGYGGAPANVLLRQRGQYYGLHLGYFFGRARAGRAARRGIMLQAGAGLLQHKIRIVPDPTNDFPQVAGNYAKGYDRLTNGLALRQSLGYRYLSNDRRINFQLEVEAFQGFTQNRRDWDIDLMATDNRARLDLLFGVRLSWILPFYPGASGDEIEY